MYNISLIYVGRKTKRSFLSGPATPAKWSSFFSELQKSVFSFVVRPPPNLLVSKFYQNLSLTL